MTPANQATLPAKGAAHDSPRAAHTLDVMILIVLGLVVGLSLKGLALKPHGDFYGLWETGDALLHGELPASFKRAPVYPLLVAALGSILRAAGLGEVPPQRAAEWINALLLPVNAVLVYWLAQHGAGGIARWVAWWFVLLPIGMYCTTNALVEPLLVTTLLLTLVAAQRRSGWAYVWAAAATMTRYDAAGAIVGLVVADRLHNRSWRGAVWRAGAAGTPLMIWLALTACTWHTRAGDHYLVEIAERPSFHPAYPFLVTHQAVFDAERLRLPAVLQDSEPLFRYGIHGVLVVLVLVGVGVGLRAHRPAVLCGATTFAGYALVHAVFPFQFDRFGYPLAPLYLSVAGLGLGAVAPHLRVPRTLQRASHVLLLAVAGVLVFVLWSELEGFGFLTSRKYAWVAPLPGAVLLATGALWGLSGPARAAALPRLATLLALAVIGLAHLRTATPRVTPLTEMNGVVEAARWVRDHVGAGERVLSGVPGLLRLYAGRQPTGRFLGFDEIAADTWPQIIAECRERRIGYVLWYDELFGELGNYYVHQCRLERFAGLSAPEQLTDVAIAGRLPGPPNVLILQVLPPTGGDP